MTRKRFSEKEVLETLAHQGVFVRCFRCTEPFFRIDADGDMLMQRKPEREHLHEIALRGPDIPANCRYSCKGCHATITNGTKATSAGSSKHRIAKVRRLRGENKPRVKKRMPSRPFPPKGSVKFARKK